MSRKYKMQEIEKWAKEFKRVWSYSEVARKFGVWKGSVRYHLLKHKDEFGIITLEEFLSELNLIGKHYCLKCFEIKPLSEFPFRTDTGKFKNECHSCIKERSKKYSKRIQVWSKKYRKENKEAIRIKKKKWKERNPDKVRASWQRRRERKRSIDGKYCAKDNEITIQIFDSKCFNCGSNKDLCIDHHKPLSKGFALSVENAVVLCKTCNLSKGAKMPENFYDELQLQNLEEMFKQARILKKKANQGVK